MRRLIWVFDRRTCQKKRLWLSNVDIKLDLLHHSYLNPCPAEPWSTLPLQTAEAVLMNTNNLCFQQKYEEFQTFLSENFHFLVVIFQIYLNRCFFVMEVKMLTVLVSTISYSHIMKTCLYNVDPLKPHFYKVKLGFTGVYIIFLISAQKHRLWVLVRTASSRRF